MLILSRNNKQIPITILGDWWLFVCLPFMLLNVVSYLFRRTFLALYFAMLRFPSTRLLALLSRHRMVNIPLLIVFNVTSSLLVYLADPAIGNPVLWVFLLLSAVSAMMILQTAKIAIGFEDGNRTDLVLKLTVLRNRQWDPEDKPLPRTLKIDKLSHSTFLGSMMVTLFVVCHFLLLVVAQTGSPLFWLSIHALILVSFLVDFEMIEHLAAHSPKGLLVRIAGKNPLAWSLFLLEKIRIYFVWPLYYWAPGKYFLTHTLHHHVENNGPADWQSTLRFDLTSLADFAKSLLWLHSSVLFPLDTGKYLWALGRKKHFWQLVKGCAYNYLAILFVLYLEPVFGIILFCLYLGMAWVFHAFIFGWHGFHDATKPYDVVASNNSTGHYGHHKQPGTHLFSSQLRDIYKKDSLLDGEEFVLHESGLAFDVLSRNWLLVQSLLWQRKFPVIRQLVKADHLADNELQRLVTGLQLHKRTERINRLDRNMSSVAGAVLEKSLLLITSGRHKAHLHPAG